MKHATEVDIDAAYDQLHDELERALDRLMESADSVQIIATRTLPDGSTTVLCSEGRGNWHARINAMECALEEELCPAEEEED